MSNIEESEEYFEFEQTIGLVSGNEGKEKLSIEDRIRLRRDRLYAVGEELKSEFIALDGIIDQLIKNIETWYVMPELLRRPVVVCLWGMTGVGKTDLVRKLVKKLDFTDKFLEIQMTNKGSSSDFYSSNLKGVLDVSNLESKKPGILLLDEIQRYRTINEQGAEIHDCKYQDVWQLLSDGRFSNNANKDAIFQAIFSDFYWTLPSKKNEEEDDDDKITEDPAIKSGTKPAKNKYKRSYYDAKRIKRALRLEETVEEIMLWDDAHKMKVAIARIESQDTYEGDDFSKLLVIISGNLDEAYRMAANVSDCSVDADVLHEFTKKINILNIKDALLTRFKPEQISRFGNVHVIYPSMNKIAYQKLIQRKIEEILSAVHEQHGIDISLNNSVYSFIYRNGVIPSQGVRPVFSTIASYIENTIPSMVLNAIEHGENEIKVSYRDEDKMLVARFGAHECLVECKGVFDTIKEETNYDEKVITAVHEAGHAVVYGLTLGIAPTQISANAASTSAEGFIGIHDIKPSRELTEKRIAILMAGRAAEEITFGSKFVSAGAYHDILQATMYASNIIRNWGMDKYNSRVRDTAFQDAADMNNIYDESINNKIEELVSKGKLTSTDLLMSYEELFFETANYLLDNEVMEPEVLVKIFANYGLEIKMIESKDSISHPYEDMFRKRIALLGDQHKSHQ